MSSDDVMREAKVLGSTHEFVTPEAALSLAAMVAEMGRAEDATPEIVLSAVELTGSLSKVMSESAAETLAMNNQITNSMDALVASKIDSLDTIDTPSIKLKVQQIDPTQQQQVVPSEGVAIDVPPNLTDCQGTRKMAAVVFSEINYKSVADAEREQSSPVLSMDSYCDGQKEEVSGLATPLRIKLEVQSVEAKAVLADIANGVMSEQQALEAGFF